MKSGAQKIAGASMFVFALLATCDAAGQGTPPPPPLPSGSTSADKDTPMYTLEIDSDDSATLSFDAIAARLATELRGSVVTPARGRTPSRAAISIRYKARTLTIRAVHAGDRVLERSIVAQGDSESVRSEAVLLAGNLARDEARELLDELNAAQPPPPPKTETFYVPAKPVSNEPPEVRRPITVGVFYPVATNMHLPNVTSSSDFSLFYGSVGRLSGFQMSMGFTHASRSVSGMQFAGLVATSGGTTDGSQLAMAATYTEKEMTAAQMATLFNWAAAGGSGAQITAGINVAGDAFSGAQLSSLANIETKKSKGAQVAAGLNWANHFEGVQLAPANVSRDFSGVQIGALNIAQKSKGVQIGALNIAEEIDGESLGILTIAKNTIHPIAWSSNLAYSNAGLKFTSRHLYTVTAIGFGTHETNFAGSPSLTVAIGGHFGFGSTRGKGFDLESELAYSMINRADDANQALHPRLIAGYGFATHFRVFVGGGPRVPINFVIGSPVVRPEFFGGLQF